MGACVNLALDSGVSSSGPNFFSEAQRRLLAGRSSMHVAMARHGKGTLYDAIVWD